MVGSPEGSESSAPRGTASVAPPARTTLLRKVVPFFIAIALMAFVFSRIDFQAFVHALAGLNIAPFLGFALLWQISLLGADALGNYAAYRLTMPNVRYTDFYVFRGASYLPGMVNHHLGQAYMTYLMSKLARMPLARVAGATLVSYAGWMACLLGCVTIALPMTNLPLGYVPVILVIGVAYLVVVAIRPKFLERIAFLAPLFEAGLRGHAISLAARVPHLAVLVLGTWLGYLFFGVKVPIGVALVYLPIMLVATTLPITPQGFGTRETLAQAFFAAYAAGATDAERLGRLTAATTAWGVAITLSGILLGLVCSQVVSRRLQALRALSGPEVSATV
ncbi:MAG: lysylphosphatidylglycerol synthase domain-containing protein [Polyangiaceae bacterium]